MSRFAGVFRGTIVNTMDPMANRRVQVRVPALVIGMDSWALATVPPGFGAGDPFYRVGDNVIVAFEGADGNSPVVLGKLG